MGIIVSLNNVYHADAMHYWCNALGEINMPGEASFSPHKPEELPPAYRDLYEKYQYETDAIHTYVVSYDGVPGMMLTALHDSCYYDDIVELSKKDNVYYDVLHNCLMEQALYILQLHATEMTEDAMFEGCTVFVGDMTDPDGHELCLFVPADKCANLDGIRERFEKRFCWRDRDKLRIKKCFDVLTQS